MNTVTSHRLRLIGSTLIAGLALLFAETPATLAGPSAAGPVAGPALSIDATAGGYPINPDIYGMNFAADSQLDDLNLPVNRWGGNSTTRYNYNNDISNHAMDWYFENIRQGNGADPKDDSAVNQMIEAGNAAGTKTLVTVPTIGYVSNDHHIDQTGVIYCGFDTSLYGNQQATDPYRSTCGNGKYPNGNEITTNNLLDTSIVADPAFVQGWVDYLEAKYGTSRPIYYALDNEPDLWYETHRDVHPLGARYIDLRDAAINYGSAIKTADPSAKVLGPVSWGWTGYFWSPRDIAEDRPYWLNNNQSPDRWANGNKPFLEWYLAAMKQYEIDNSIRLLDYLDIHFYTQVPGVSLSNAGGTSTKAARLRSTRSLWDMTYGENADGSWIDEPVYLIPRMHTIIDTNYPGTKLAITEYNWGGLEDMNGALAQADVLGIFGREKVDLATIWGPPDPGQPGEYAFRMYLNYDSAGGHFGDTSITSSSADQSKLAIYGSKDSGSGALKVMVINKTGSVLTSPVTLSNFANSPCITTYTYSAADLDNIVQGWAMIGSGSFSATFPANSITLYVIPPSSAGCGIPASALAAPLLSAPKASAVVTTPTVKFSWKKLKGALSYHVQVDDNGGFTSPELDAPSSGTSQSVLLNYGTYNWRVQAIAADGITAYSATNVFDLTLLTTPKKGATVKVSKVSFKWKAVKNATYHLEVWRAKGTGSELKVVNETSLTKPTYKPLSPTPFEAGYVYTWTVTVNGQTMPEWTFTTIP